MVQIYSVVGCCQGIASLPKFSFSLSFSFTFHSMILICIFIKKIILVYYFAANLVFNGNKMCFSLILNFYTNSNTCRWYTREKNWIRVMSIIFFSIMLVSAALMMRFNRDGSDTISRATGQLILSILTEQSYFLLMLYIVCFRKASGYKAQQWWVWVLCRGISTPLACSCAPHTPVSYRGDSQVTFQLSQTIAI